MSTTNNQTPKSCPIGIYFVLLYFSFCVSDADEISLNGNGFLRYDIRRERFNPNVNRVKFEFRTTHPSGTIVYATGTDSNILRIDIAQGRLRVRITRKQKTVNEVLTGSKLDDNTWHKVNILRANRLLNLNLDEQRERVILIPGKRPVFNLNKVIYIGGAGKAVTQKDAGISDGNDQEEQITPFKGCLKNVIIDNKQPLLEVRKRNKNLVIYGIISRPCHVHSFNPIEFPKPQSVFSVGRIPSSSVEQEMGIRLQFRTFDPEGTILYAEGKRCHFILGIQKKQVYLELVQDDVLPAKVETQRETNDGLWHKVKASVTQTEIYLQVDDGTRVSASLPKTTSVYQCSLPSRLLIGGGTRSKDKRGFVGCLHKININERDIDPFDGTGVVNMKRGIKQGCKVKDKCFPNPCRNGGSCFQTWHSYGCECSKTTFYGKHCNTPMYKTTCTGYKDLGLEKPSNCIIDSDGTGGLAPFTVSCDIHDGKIATVVHHNKEATVNVTDGADFMRSYVHVVDYQLTMEQIEAVIKSSVNCRQFLRFDCYNAALMNSPNGPPNAMWHTRKEEVKSYWGGVPDGGKGCKCGLTRSCLRRDKLCNCDSLNNRWVEDSGYIENKDLLPITRMHFTSILHGFGHVTLGPLECFGSKGNEKSEERPRSKILSHVCMSIAARKSITNNETKLVWNTIADNDRDDVDIRIDYYSKRNPSAKPTKQYSTLNITTDNSDTFRTKMTINPKSPKQSSVNETNNALLENQSNSPFDSMYRNSGDQSLSVLEIILIVFAALSVSVLLVKFVILKAIDFVRRRYQIKRLYLNESARNTNSVDQPLKSNDQTEFRIKKGVLRKSRNSDWV